jgi:hypothetical protein
VAQYHSVQLLEHSQGEIDMTEITVVFPLKTHPAQLFFFNFCGEGLSP